MPKYEVNEMSGTCSKCNKTGVFTAVTVHENPPPAGTTRVGACPNCGDTQLFAEA